ncbi:histone acetyltransferases subunit 3-domain-containing protein [Parasitella parasitica]|nr:histone acetyltransferases subunit 3-domain-containing protein [Parasitella parasitica]
MNTDLTRQYGIPQKVSNTTNSIIKQFKPTVSPQQDECIPDNQELIIIKADLESMLHSSQSRIKNLKKDQLVLERHVKIRDGDSNDNSSGKGVAPINRMGIKQEKDDDLDMLNSSSSIPKPELSRQAALEVIRRRRRREETEGSDERRSESSHVNIKLKKVDAASPLLPQSESPPPVASKQRADVKKVKRPSSARGNHTDSKHSKNHNSKQKSQPLEEVDFVRVKPKDQVPITTFWTTLEPYFRNLTEEDREYLMQKSDQCKPYLIPPLGQHYAEKWAEEDQSLGLHTSESKLKHLQHTMSTDSQRDADSSSLTDRLISSLVKENLLPEEIIHSEDDGDDEEEQLDETGRASGIMTDALEKRYNAKTVTQLSPDPTEDIVGFEERLKRELRYAGLFGDEDIDWNAKEDDEICAELRTLGHELKDQIKLNDHQKKRLLEVVDHQLQFEQYRQVLDTLDSQVEQGYLKRFRPQKSKKRKSAGPKTVLSENAVFAMERRKTWVNALGCIFNDKNMTMPASSIYEQPPFEESTTSSS